MAVFFVYEEKPDEHIWQTRSNYIEGIKRFEDLSSKLKELQKTVFPGSELSKNDL